MTIDQMINKVTKAIENGQTIKVYGTHYPVMVEINSEAIYTANSRREVYYQLQVFEQVIWA